jgi:hypothetical protein
VLEEGSPIHREDLIQLLESESNGVSHEHSASFRGPVTLTAWSPVPDKRSRRRRGRSTPRRSRRHYIDQRLGVFVGSPTNPTCPMAATIGGKVRPKTPANSVLTQTAQAIPCSR